MATDTVNNDTLVAMYVKLRDTIKAKDEAHAKELQPFKDGMAKIESVLLGQLNTSGTESMRTNSGTFFKKKKESVTVASRETFYEWAVRTGQQDLLDIRAAKVNILDYKEKTGELPPGLDYRAEVEVQVRRS